MKPWQKIAVVAGPTVFIVASLAIAYGITAAAGGDDPEPPHVEQARACEDDSPTKPECDDGFITSCVEAGRSWSCTHSEGCPSASCNCTAGVCVESGGSRGGR